MKKSVKVKICGIRKLIDALLAAEAGADAVGFVFHQPSPRYIDPEDAGRIISDLPPFLTTVGVFVNEEKEKAKDVAGQAGVDVIQLHGDEPPEYCRGFHQKLIKSFRVNKTFDCRVLRTYHVNAFLLDAYDEAAYGGTGKTFDWEVIREARKYGPIILAGGLNPENAARAVKEARPYAVDVSSGVESEKGIKDHKKILKFIRAVKGQAI